MTAIFIGSHFIYYMYGLVDDVQNSNKISVQYFNKEVLTNNKIS